jgi:hypothetical protein
VVEEPQGFLGDCDRVAVGAAAAHVSWGWRRRSLAVMLRPLYAAAGSSLLTWKLDQRRRR